MAATYAQERQVAAAGTGSSPAQPGLPFYAEQGSECALFAQCHAQQLPLLIKGPTGCGKTRFVEHMAARLGRPLITVSCHDDLSAADLVGRHLIGQGSTVWADGPLTRAVREGAIVYLDEVVEARKDTTVVLHPLADDRRILPIERTGEQLKAPADFMLVISYNPGYQNLLKGLKPSTRQRFTALTLDYPAPAVERRILETEGAPRPPSRPGWCNWRRRYAGSPTTTWKKPPAPACWSWPPAWLLQAWACGKPAVPPWSMR